VLNFGVILLCQTCIFISFSSVFPFLPIYLQELGETEKGAIAWAGAIQSSASAVLLTVTPLWGALSDRVGRKPMLVRSLVGACISLTLLGFVSHAWQVLGLRLFQGVTAGTNAAIIALAAGVLPQARLSTGMGLLQTAQFLGVSLGPLVGGVTFTSFGFRTSFVAAGVAMFIITLLVWLFVREPGAKPARTEKRPSLMQSLAAVSRAPRLRTTILAMLGFQAAYSTSNSLLPLQIDSLVGDSADSASSFGLVLAAGAIGIAIGSAALGWLGGRISPARIALGSLMVAMLLTGVQVAFSHPLQFIPLRFVLGFFAGGVMPSLRSALAQDANADPATRNNLGALYGLAQSAFTGGQGIGPAVASVTATTWGLSMIHAASAALLAITFGLFFLARAAVRQRAKQESEVTASF
jgi:DHA1 family multidrug resistance protein-like MFS transporter